MNSVSKYQTHKTGANFKRNQLEVTKIKSPLSENLIRKKDLAQMLSLSIPMIDKLMAKGLPHYKIGKAVRFNYSEVMEHLERRKFP